MHHLFLEYRWRWRPKATSLSVYEPRETDVIVTTIGKCGTTLLQQMAYQIAVLSGGAGPTDKTGEDFNDIIEVAPWVEFCVEFGVQIYESTPRILKTAQEAQIFYKAGHDIQKHIVVIRDPAQYPSSFLNFMFDDIMSHSTIPGAESIEEHALVCSNDAVRYHVFHNFVKTELLGQPFGPEILDEEVLTAINEREGSKTIDLASIYGRMNWFRFAKSWLDVRAREKCKSGSRILVLFYEDIVQDLEKTVRIVSKFMNVTLPENRPGIQTVVERCTRDYMVDNEKFKCQVEARSFKLGRLLKCHHESFVGFKKYSLNEHERHCLRSCFRATFNVNSYDEFKNQVYAGTL